MDRTMKKHLILLCSLFFAIVMVCVATVPAAGAAPDDCSLILEYVDEEADTLDGRMFQLYCIAEGGLDGYQMTEDFAEMQEDVEQTNWDTAEGMTALADTLTAYLADEDIAPDYTETTDRAGRASFSQLSMGLYLVLGDDLVKGECTYQVQHVLIWLPCEDPDGGLDYAPVCTPKYENVGGQTEVADIRVEKVWVDDGDHPSSVTILLLSDDEVVDEVTLSEQNNWEYLWEGLETDHDWQVEEKDVPEGYTAKVTRSGNTFTVTNTKKLPQTGQLWWPVTVMLGIGLPLLLAGLVLLLRGKKKSPVAGELRQ